MYSNTAELHLNAQIKSHSQGYHRSANSSKNKNNTNAVVLQSETLFSCYSQLSYYSHFPVP